MQTMLSATRTGCDRRLPLIFSPTPFSLR
jgi:hypothetical protein